MIAEREQEPIALGKTRLEDDAAGDAAQLLHPHTGVPEAVFQELELFPQTLSFPLGQRQEVTLQGIVEEDDVAVFRHRSFNPLGDAVPR